ncbi:MAG TPA: hypothetical protein PLH57_11440, partial [Oligoflexia bacterium]|nr:hypothetical protein [Oligoflexia bacterium]
MFLGYHTLFWLALVFAIGTLRPTATTASVVPASRTDAPNCSVLFSEIGLLKQYGEITILPADDQRELFRRFLAGDREAGNQFALQFVRFAAWRARSFQRSFPAFTFEELFLAGWLAIGREMGLRRYNPDLGTPMSYFGAPVNWAIIAHIRTRKRIEGKYIHSKFLESTEQIHEQAETTGALPLERRSHESPFTSEHTQNSTNWERTRDLLDAKTFIQKFRATLKDPKKIFILDDYLLGEMERAEFLKKHNM